MYSITGPASNIFLCLRCLFGPVGPAKRRSAAPARRPSLSEIFCSSTTELRRTPCPQKISYAFFRAHWTEETPYQLKIKRVAPRNKNSAAVASLTRPRRFCMNLVKVLEVAPKRPKRITAMSGRINDRL